MSFFSELGIDDRGLLAKVYRSQSMTCREIIDAYRKLYQEIVIKRRMYPLSKVLFESSVWRGSRFIENPKYQDVVLNMIFSDQEFAKKMKLQLFMFCCDLFFMRGQVYPPFGRIKFYFSVAGFKILIKVIARRSLEALGVKKFT